MKLNELNFSGGVTASKALKENYNIKFDVSNFTKVQTIQSLRKVRNIIKETRNSPLFYKKQQSPAFMKLVFMEQALVNKLVEFKEAKLIVENEQVEKSQVILAAQDIVDSVQKMIEQIGDITIKQLPSLKDGIQSEIGANEAEEYFSKATETLNGLTSTLNDSKSQLQAALGIVTGEQVVTDFNNDAVSDEPEEPANEPEDIEIPDEEVPSVIGRNRR